MIFFSVSNALGTTFLAPELRISVDGTTREVLKRSRSDNGPIGFLADVETVGREEIMRVLTRSVDLGDQEQVVEFPKQPGNAPVAVFSMLAEKMSRTPQAEPHVLISGNSWQRSAARTAGWQVCPHALLLESVLANERLRYLSFSIRDSGDQDVLNVVKDLPVVILEMMGGSNGRTLAIASDTTSLELVERGLEVRFLGTLDLPLESDLHLLRDDRVLRGGKSQARQHFCDGEKAEWLLDILDSQLLVAIPAGRFVDEVHFEETEHGHVNALRPCNPQVVEERIQRLNAPLQTLWAGVQGAQNKGEPFESSVVSELRRIGAEEIHDLVRRFSGDIPTKSSGSRRILSRHFANEGNRLAVKFAAKELRSSLKRLGSVELQPAAFGTSNVIGEIPGDTSQIIVLGAHIDSTSRTDESDAPGADDNATGVAAVITVCRHLAKLAKEKLPKRTVRFVLFNAEEQGQHGSKVHREGAAAEEQDLLGVFNLDMIGYNATPPATFEIHCGYSKQAIIEERSLELGRLVRDLTPYLAPELSPQLLPDGTNEDRGESRSDHTPFHECGFAACWISEDFFSTSSGTDGDRNPHYHRSSDVPSHIDMSYTAGIARVVAGSLWFLANA